MALALLASLLAAAPLPAKTLPATVRTDCAPWDGPAFTITVPLARRSAEPPTMLTIAIWKPADGHTPLSFVFPRDGSQGSVTLQPRPGVAGLLTGQVRFRSVLASHPVEGSFDLISPGGQIVRGRFRALWERSQRTLCG
jgi:hypothetical protein